MNNYPRFEKANDGVIRIISEKVDEVSLKQLLENKKQIETKMTQMQEVLKNINEILENAAKLGITTDVEKEKKSDNKINKQIRNNEVIE